MTLRPEQLLDDEYRRNPAPVWALMRNDHPLFHDTVNDVYWLTRYADVAAVFADHETYSASTYELTTGQVIGPTLISRDDHGHVVRRSIVAPDFVGKRLAKYEDTIVSSANALIDTFVDDGQVDLVKQFSTRLPVDVISGMLGMVGDGDQFRGWVTDMIRGLAPTPGLRERGLEARAEFCNHIAPALQGVDDPERTDHIAKIARAEVEGQRLDDNEITAFCGLLFIAGGETTDKAIANMWFNLLGRPADFEAVRRDLSLWDNAFSETMRLTPPVTSEDRFTTAPVEWYGTEIPEGARVRVSIGAAHLDETVFADPSTFDLNRQDLHLTKELRSGGSTTEGRSGHLGFGLGKHFCIGYELARREAVVGSNLLLDRCGGFEVAPGAEPYLLIQGNSFQAAQDLRLVFDTN
ncbi:MAG: cytochrome P450 [Acidimicrobiales bacterium]